MPCKLKPSYLGTSPHFIVIVCATFSNINKHYTPLSRFDSRHQCIPTNVIYLTYSMCIHYVRIEFREKSSFAENTLYWFNDDVFLFIVFVHQIPRFGGDKFRSKVLFGSSIDRKFHQLGTL